MADNVTPSEGGVVENTPPQTEVPEPEAISEGTPSTEEGEETPTLPSDIGEFTMPEKFEGKSAEDIAKAYVELEKLKARQTPPTEETPPTTTEGEVDSSKYFQEYLEKGTLSEESITELEAAGYSKDIVTQQLEFAKYKQEKTMNEVTSVIGGVEEYTAMKEWAATNLPEDTLKAYGEELGKSGRVAQQAILKDLYAQYKEAVGNAEDILHTNEPQQVVGRGYTSQHELQKDMADSRYGRDRSYTQAVELKLSRSNLENI